MTGCPSCGQSMDAQNMVAKTSCPICRTPLRGCKCASFLIAGPGNHHDPDECRARDYACKPAGLEVFRSRNMILHHHQADHE